MWVTFCFVVYIMEMPRYNDILSYPHYISFKVVLYKFLFPTAKLYPKLWDIRPKVWDIHPKAWDIEIWWDIKTLPVGFANFYGGVG